MRKICILTLFFILILSALPSCYAVNIGTYKTETEYGLLDGFKVNWKRKDKSEPFLEPREESKQQDKEKELRYYKESEYERTKFMYDGKAIL